MVNTRKFLTIITSCLIAFSSTACGNKNTDGQESSNANQSVTEESVTEPTIPEVDYSDLTSIEFSEIMGEGADDYRWLWELMYTRMTEYFELDNLIWVWNGQSKEYIVTERMFDIASVDVYISADKEYGSRYEQFASLQDFIGQDKLIALSECSDVPDIDAVFRDNSVWSFFGLWYGNYLMNDDGTLSEEYTTKDELVKNYNSKGAMTLDKYHELTDFVVTTTATTSTANTTTVTTTTTVSSESSTVS